MIPLETAAIEPAWKTLSMRPDEYVSYLASLPFGKKYLLERSAVTQLPEAQAQPAHPTQEVPKAQPSQPVLVEVKPHLEEQQQAFLEYIVTNPDTPYTEVYKGLEISMRRGVMPCGIVSRHRGC